MSELPKGIRRALGQARRAVDPELAQREMLAVRNTAALSAHQALNRLKHFEGDYAELERIRVSAELLLSEVKALQQLCAGEV